MNERFTSLLKSPWTIPVVTAVSAFSSGFGAGYLFCKKRNATSYVYVVEDPPLDSGFDTEGLSEARHIIDAEKYESGALAPQSDAEVDGDHVIVTPLVQGHDEEVDEPLVTVNVFGDDDWNWEEELEGRDETEPYVLHQEEYRENQLGYTQLDLVFYAADNIMVDDNNEMVPNYPAVMGELKFGHGSGDPNVVYIRNNDRRAEYEILLNESSFAIEVLGQQAEAEAEAKDLRHSRHPRFLKDT